MAKNPVIDTLKLSPDNAKRILAQLDRSKGNPNPGTKRRGMRRWSMQAQKCIVIIRDDHGSTKMYTAIPRDLSSSGASFLFGTFLHPGIRCEFAPRRIGGRSQALPGTVVRCRHVEGHVHEVALAFDEQINPRDYFIDSGEDYLFNAEAIDPNDLAGDVLVLCANADDSKLVKDCTQSTRINLTHESNIDNAISLTRQHGFDFAFVYNNLTHRDGADALAAPQQTGGTTGLDFIQRVRAEGLLTPMVLINDAYDRELRMAAIAAGAFEMLAKPLAWVALYQATGEFLAEFTKDHDAQLQADLASLQRNLAQGAIEGDPASLNSISTSLSEAVLAQNQAESLNLLKVLEFTADSLQCPGLAAHAKETGQLLQRIHTCPSIHPRVRVIARMSRTLANAA